MEHWSGLRGIEWSRARINAKTGSVSLNFRPRASTLAQRRLVSSLIRSKANEFNWLFATERIERPRENRPVDAKREYRRRVKMDSTNGGDTVSTEAVAARRHAGPHLPAIG
jgi:hypothetical protein